MGDAKGSNLPVCVLQVRNEAEAEGYPALLKVTEYICRRSNVHLIFNLVELVSVHKSVGEPQTILLWL